MSHRDAPGGTPRWKPKELTAEQIINYWNNLTHPDGKHLGLIGGEPTLHRGFAKIVQNLEGYAITVTSNLGSSFFKDPNFVDRLKTKPNSTLRMNTSFHPDSISPEKYLNNVALMKSAGIWVEQTSFVHTPTSVIKWQKEIEFVHNALREMGFRGLYPDVYLGFWNEEDGFDATTSPTNLWPRGDQDVETWQRAHLGVDDWQQFKEATGTSEKYYIEYCSFAKEKMLVAPNGDVFACHYKLYHGIDPMYNITEFNEPGDEQTKCGHYGYCLTCSFPQHEVSPKVPVVASTLFNRDELNVPEIKSLSLELQDLSAEKNAIYNEKFLFETAMMYLYSGHRHYGSILYYGDLKNVLLTYLKDKRYKLQYGKLGFTTLTKKKKKVDAVIFSDHNLGTNDMDSILAAADLIRDGGHLVLGTSIATNAQTDKDEHTLTLLDLYTKIIEPLKEEGFIDQGRTDYYNTSIGSSDSIPVGEIYSYGVITLRKEDG